MRCRKAASMISGMNEYSHLKWLLTFASILTTFLAFIILLSFRSDSWYTYELIHTDNKSLISNTTRYSRLLEYGSIGLWRICNGHSDDLHIKCDGWTKETRPHSFNVLIILISCALFLSNLTVFPSWAASILILYNLNHRYIRHIVAFIWILFFLTLSFTIILMTTILLLGLTQFSSPGKFLIDTKYLFFHSGQGLYYASFATILAIICLILIIATLIWKKMIDMRLMEAEKELLKQLTDDSYRPGWHKIPMSTINHNSSPPPYDY